MSVSRVIVLDFETYYDSDYSLTRLTIPEYVQDPRFQIIGVAVSVNGDRPRWYSYEHVSDYKVALSPYRLDNDDCIVVAHNAIFDGSILEWQLGISPHRYFCTMMGSRPFIVPYTGRSRLETVANHLKLGQKGTEIARAKGKRWGDFSGDEMLHYAVYCTNDVQLTWGIFRHLIPQFPRDEVDLLDLTIKKFTRPQLRVNTHLVATALQTAVDKKERCLDPFHGRVKATSIRSNTLFAGLLNERGVSPPVKISPTTGKRTWAFAKTDPEFINLLRHPNQEIRDLVKARLILRSTIEETRLQTFWRIGRAMPNADMPVALLYYGAHPGRFSGLDSTNLQNLTRGSILRKVLVAPPGYKVVAGDLSQIECRITAALAGQDDLLESFRHYDNLPDSDRDVYCEFGDSVYNRRITKVDKDPRFVSKMGMLSLQYQVGAPKFHEAMTTAGIDMQFDDAQNVVRTYRNRYWRVPMLWATMTDLIMAMAAGAVRQYGPVSTSKDRLHLPNGMVITYPNLANHGGSFMYTFGDEARYLYGGKLTENVSQALARIVLAVAELKMFRLFHLAAALQVHDELVYVVPERIADATVKALRYCLTASVPWLPNLPMNCEIHVGDNYAEVK